MKSVVMIAYNFPPEGNAGAYRPLRFVRHLAALGWQPTVVTFDAANYERYDASLLKQIPDDIKVIRVRNRDPWQRFQDLRRRQTATRLRRVRPEETQELMTVRSKLLRSWLPGIVRTLESWRYHPDIAMGWIAPAAKAVAEVCAGKPIDVIWATAGPVSAFHVAAEASRRTGVPYVLDFRDAWTITFNEFDDRQPLWARRRQRRNMARFLREAQSVVFRYEAEAECYWRAYPGSLDPARVWIIPNGFDGEVKDITAPKGKECQILYTGTLSDYRYDPLLDAIRQLKQAFPNEAAQLNLHFVGEGTEAIALKAQEFGMGEIVTAEGPVPQDALGQRVVKAHALLVLGRPPSMRGYELFAAAKLFGYLRERRPIIGVLPPDEAKAIMMRLAPSMVADVNAVAEIVAVLRRLVQNWRADTLASLVPDAEGCSAFSAEVQSEILSHALNGDPIADCFVPGRAKVPESLMEDIRQREKAAAHKFRPESARKAQRLLGTEHATSVSEPRSPERAS
jgi:hypothetical protein